VAPARSRYRPLMGTEPEAPRPAMPNYAPPSSANYPGWMPPGTSNPPGLPGPPSRFLSRGRQRSLAGCLVTVALFLVVVAGLIWVVRTAR